MNMSLVYSLAPMTVVVPGLHPPGRLVLCGVANEALRILSVERLLRLLVDGLEPDVLVKRPFVVERLEPWNGWVLDARLRHEPQRGLQVGPRLLCPRPLVDGAAPRLVVLS